MNAVLSNDPNPSMKRKIMERKMIDHEFPAGYGPVREPRQGERAGNAMNTDRFGRTPDEVEDETRHAFAKCTGVPGAVADRLTAITMRGKPIDRDDLRHIHDQLFEVYESLGSETVFGMGDEPATDAEQAALDAYHDTYSDGTPVSILVQPPNRRGWSAPSEFYERDIPWLPNTTGNGGFVAPGPTPPGCEGIVVDPPNRRVGKTQPARQGGAH